MTSKTESGIDAPRGLGWLYVDFNSYFASVEQQLQPRLRGKPVAVVPVETDATCAIAASYEAKAYGISTGTMIFEAKKKCPDLICVLAQHERYVDFHQRILTEIDRHIPVTQVCSIDEVACKLMRNETTPARATEIALSIKKGIAENIGDYVRCSVGVAANKYLAKVATDMQKPDGLVILSPDDVFDRLQKLDLRDLPGIGMNMEHRLNRAGIKTVRDLLSLQPKHLRAVWGSVWGEKMWYLLHGYDIPDPVTKRSSIGHSHVLPPELRPPKQAIFVARRLMMKAAARLRRMDYCTKVAFLAVRCVDGKRMAMEARLDPTGDSFTLMDILEPLWAGVMQELGNRPVKKISVTLGGLVKPENIQPDLFSQALPETRKSVKNKKLSQVMDDLNLKYGRDTVLLGMSPAQGRGFTGTKIAFTRIPDVEEFKE